MDDDKKRQFLLDLYITRFRAICRSQTIYVHTLLLYLAFLWVWQTFEGENALSLGFAGFSMTARSIWPVTPAVVTLLCLGLVGSLNAMGPVWRRLRRTLKDIEPNLFFTDLDTSSNILDYFALLTVSPEKKLQIEGSPWGGGATKWRVQRFLYPGLMFLGSIATALSWARGPSGYFYRAYVVLCISLQVLFSIRIWWRAVCGALNRRLEENEMS